MSDDKKYVVIKSGQRITDGLSKEDAETKAAEINRLNESSGQAPAASVVPLLLG